MENADYIELIRVRLFYRGGTMMGGGGEGGQWWISIELHIIACVVNLFVLHASPQINIHSCHAPHMGPYQYSGT